MDYIRAVFRQKIVDEDDREKGRNPFLIRAVFRLYFSENISFLSIKCGNVQSGQKSEFLCI